MFSSRRNAIVMSLAWWYARRLIRKHGIAAATGLIAGQGLTFAGKPPRKRHRLRWLLLFGLIAGAGAFWWQQRRGGGDDWGDWEPIPPVGPEPAEPAPMPEPEPVAT